MTDIQSLSNGRSSPLESSEEMQVLYHASKLGRTDIIQHALASLRSQNDGANIAEFVSTADDEGKTALHIASFNGHSDAVRALLNMGADPTLVPREGEFKGKTAYEVSTGGATQAFRVYTFEQIAMGNISGIESLLRGRVPVDLTDDTKLKDSTLHWACSFGNQSVGELLLKLGIDVNIANTESETCLHIACKAGNKEFIELLLNHGADRSLRDARNRLPLDLLPLEHGEYGELAAMLQCSDTNEPKQTSFNPTNSISVSSAGNDEEGRSSELETSDSLPSESGYETDSDAEGVGESHPSKHLILWPPAQRQVQYTLRPDGVGPQPLVLSTTQPVIVSTASPDIDIYALLTWSGLIETLETVGVYSQIQRSSTTADIRLAIDQNICPGRHRFEIRVDSSMARLTASDPTGIMYAVHTFVQILQLHADFVNSGTSASTPKNMKSIRIPPMTVLDWPDIPNRGVMWSYRCTTRTSSSGMKSLVRLLSVLRVNQLFLSVDVPHCQDDSTSMESCDEIMFGTKICSLDEVCRRHCVELIPTVTLLHPRQMLPLNILRNFSAPCVTVILNYCPQDEDEDVFAKECFSSCEDMFRDVLSSGHRNVIVAHSDWITTMLLDDLEALALHVGVTVQFYPLAQFISSRLLSRPITSSQVMAKQVTVKARQAQAHGSTLCMLPAMSDADFFYPMILFKHMCYLHAGACWNLEAFQDILGRVHLDDHSLLRPTLNLLLFRNFSAREHPREDKLRGAILDLLCGSVPLSESASQRRVVASGEDMARIEGIVWSLMGARNLPSDMTIPIRKEEAVECLRGARSLLLAVDWKDLSKGENGTHVRARGGSDLNAHYTPILNSSGNSEFHVSVAETEEFMNTLQLVSVVCRIIILAYNALEKATMQKDNTLDHGTDHHSYGKVMASLSPGTASDLANALIEALFQSNQGWQKRFDKFSLVSGQVPMESNEHISKEKVHTRITAVKSVKYLKAMDRHRYVEVARAEVPAVGVFAAICRYMPDYTTDLLMKVFREEPKESEKPVSSSWSIWKR